MTDVPPHLHPPEAYGDLCDYIRFFADELGLRDWTLIIDQDPAEDGCLASIHPTDGRRVAVLAFSRRWWKESPEDPRQTVIHELLHLHHRDAADVVLTLPDVLSHDTYRTLWEVQRQQFELMTDNIATAIDRHYPTLPEFVDDDERTATYRWEGARGNRDRIRTGDGT